MSSLCIYYGRVSTKEQGISGLGLSAQKKAVKSWAKKNGLNVFLSFEEVASGNDDERPELELALAKARELSIPVVVSKLDRLSRRVSFISKMMEDGVSFVTVELGRQVDDLVLHIFAAFAESERKAISARTKAALAAKKAQGFKLGNPNIHLARAKANQVRGARADARARAATSELLEMMISHHKTVRLRCGLKPVFQNDVLVQGFGWMCPDGTFTKKQAVLKMETKTARGGAWSVVQLNRAINRASTLRPPTAQSDLLSLTMGNAALYSYSHTFASRNLQRLEWEGRLVEVLTGLIESINDERPPETHSMREAQEAFWGDDTHKTLIGMKVANPFLKKD